MQAFDEHVLALWGAHLQRSHYAPLTVRDYLGLARRLLRFCGVSLQEITQDQVRAYLDAAGLAPGTWVNQHTKLSLFFAWALLAGRVAQNPCDSLSCPRAVPHHWRYLPLDLFLRWDAALPVTGRLVLHLAYYSGLRRNEILHVRTEDLRLNQALLYVVAGKGAWRTGPKPRWTVLHRDTVALITRFLSQSGRDAGYLIGNGRQRMDGRTLYRLLYAGRNRAGIPREFVLHSCRHGFAKLLKLRNVSVEVAANLLGHDDLETTRRIYGALTPEEMRGIYQTHVECQDSPDNRQIPSELELAAAWGGK